MEVKTTKQDERRWVCEGHRTVGKLAHDCCADVQRFALSCRVKRMGLASRYESIRFDS
jgi:hypothetical protein